MNSVKRKANTWRRLVSVMTLVLCLIVTSLGLSACGSPEGNGAAAGSSVVSQTRDAAESLTESAIQDTAESLSEDIPEDAAEHPPEEIVQAAEDSRPEEGISQSEEPDSQLKEKDSLSEELASQSGNGESELSVEEDGTYSDKDHVALYLHTYGHLPDNYIRKNDARDLGWDAGKGNLWEVAPGMSIGGDHFGNREGSLPEVKGRKYYECDINYEGGYRGGERIVYSNDGEIYYSEDHYDNFELLYTEEGKAE